MTENGVQEIMAGCPDDDPEKVKCIHEVLRKDCEETECKPPQKVDNAKACAARLLQEKCPRDGKFGCSVVGEPGLFSSSYHWCSKL